MPDYQFLPFIYAILTSLIVVRYEGFSGKKKKFPYVSQAWTGGALSDISINISRGYEGSGQILQNTIITSVEVDTDINGPKELVMCAAII